jgi:hypothetical protein
MWRNLAVGVTELEVVKFSKSIEVLGNRFYYAENPLFLTCLIIQQVCTCQSHGSCHKIDGRILGTAVVVMILVTIKQGLRL